MNHVRWCFSNPHLCFPGYFCKISGHRCPVGASRELAAYKRTTIHPQTDRRHQVGRRPYRCPAAAVGLQFSFLPLSSRRSGPPTDRYNCRISLAEATCREHGAALEAIQRAQAGALHLDALLAAYLVVHQYPPAAIGVQIVAV